jgi:hypothetical protein
MWLARRSLTPKARRFLVIGNLCLVAGLLMSVFDKDFGLHHANLYHATRGLLFGLAIGFNVGAVRMARRCPETHA